MMIKQKKKSTKVMDIVRPISVKQTSKRYLSTTETKLVIR